MSSSVILESPLTKPLNNSNTVAIVASVGIHALVLGVALPYLAATSSKDSTDLTDVELIELTEAEQSRLPSLSTPTPDLTQFSNQSLDNIPLLDTPTIDPNQIPPSLESFSSTQTPSLPALPPLEGLRSAPSLPPLPQMNIYSPPVAALPPNLPRNLPAPEQLRSPQRYQAPETPFREENIRPNFPDAGNEFGLDQLRKSPVTQGYQRQQEITEQQETALSDPRVINPEIEEERQRRLRADLIANAQRLQQSLQPDSANTSSDEATKNWATWTGQNTVQQGFAQGMRKEHLNMSINGNYPAIASGRQIEGTSVYGVVVDASGKPVDVQLIQSAGYPILNKQAKEDILRQVFQNPTGGKQSFVVSVNYKDPNPTRNLPQPTNNQRQTTPSRDTTPTTPAAAPSPQPVQPSTQPTNQQPANPITKPNNPANQQPPVVEQSPIPENIKPETQPEQPANKPQETQNTPIVEQSPLPENIKPEPISSPEQTQPNPPSPTVAEPPAAPASQKPNPDEINQPTSQKPINSNIAPLGNTAPKKPTTPSPEAQNAPSSNPSGT